MADSDEWSNSSKWWFSITLGLLFFVFASVIAMSITHAGLSAVGFQTSCVDNGTNDRYWAKILVLAIIFAIIVRIVLW